MAISKIASAGIGTTDSITASQLAPDSVGLSELTDATGVTEDYHKVPTFANDSARDSAIPSPTVGMLIYNTAEGAVQQYNGNWATIAPPPNITALSGFLNDDSDSTITVFGTNFTSASVAKMFTAASGGTQIGSAATTTFVSSTNIKAVFGAGSIGASGSTAYIEVDNAGATNRFSTAITVNADPTVVHAGATGTSANTTTHLGTYTGGVSEVDANTKLLLNFDRGGGTDFEDSSNIGDDGHKVTASNNAAIKASPFGDGKSAMKFDGSDDYFTIPAHADFNFGTGDFTMEYWAYQTADALAVGICHYASSSDRWFFGDWAWNRLGFDYNNGSWVNVASATGDFNDIGLNQWHHIAISVASSTARLFINGILQGSRTSYPSINSTGGLWIGVGNGGSLAAYHNGYIDEIRISKGIARYTSNFTPSTTRFASDSNTSLLIHSNLGVGSLPGSTFTDSSGTTKTLTKYSTPIHSTLYNVSENTVTPSALTFATSGKAFGSAGAYFDGATDYVTIASSPVLGTADFTIDFWINVAATQNAGETTYYIWEGRTDNNNDNSLAITMNASDQLQVYNTRSDKDTAVIAYHADTAVTAGTWTHVALVRSATSVLKLYIGGVATANTTSTIDQGALDNDGTSLLGIQWQVAAYEFTGYIDVFRISDTARWAANFTPPTKLYIGADEGATIPTITFTGTATQLAADEDIEFTAVENTTKADGSRSFIDTDIGLTLTNLTGSDKSKATLTGTLTSAGSTTHTNMPLKLQVRKTLGNAAYANASRTVTFSSSTTTIGLAPAMPVTGTGIPANTTITSVDTTTTITLSANPTGGTLTGQSLIFSDLTRVSHQYNGSDTINTSDTMYTLATGVTSTGPALFNARRYVGNELNREITGFGFQPDMVWVKSRTEGASGHYLWDSIRPVGQALFPHAATAPYTYSSGHVQNFTNDGFVLEGSSDGTNGNGHTYIAWGWKAGGKPSGVLAASGQTHFGTNSNYNGLTVGAGTIHDSATGVSALTNLTQSVSQASGLSITSFDGAAAGGTFPHGLGSAPDFVMIKGSLTTAIAWDWTVWHRTGLSSPTTKHIKLNGNLTEDSASDFFPTAPSSTIVTIGGRNASGGVDDHDHIYYCWKTVAGVSSFGTYTGSNSTSTKTVTLPNSETFTPKLVIIKNRTTNGNWRMYDSARGTGTAGNSDAEYVNANTASAANDAGDSIIFGAGQFTMTTTNVDLNASDTYLYAAFA